mmetsp:Transcript_13587/g.30837  ORF Transcript_13587/g.30837 Transcript_13587/m.30837 type:complete len:217 (+) Transcript_13587:390-1040(+)
MGVPQGEDRQGRGQGQLRDPRGVRGDRLRLLRTHRRERVPRAAMATAGDAAVCRAQRARVHRVRDPHQEGDRRDRVAQDQRSADDEGSRRGQAETVLDGRQLRRAAEQVAREAGEEEEAQAGREGAGERIVGRACSRRRRSRRQGGGHRGKGREGDARCEGADVCSCDCAPRAQVLTRRFERQAGRGDEARSRDSDERRAGTVETVEGACLPGLRV